MSKTRIYNTDAIRANHYDRKRWRERDTQRETETERDGGREGRGAEKEIAASDTKKNVSFAFIYKIMHFLYVLKEMVFKVPQNL